MSDFVIPDPEDFFFDPKLVRTHIQRLQPLDAIECIKDVRQQWEFAIQRMTQARMELPMKDKAKAKIMALKIEAARKAIRELRPLAIDKQGKVEKQQEHTLWAQAVFHVCGQEALTACYDFMKAKRKQHAANRPQAPSGPDAAVEAEQGP